jgi:hypothetical protein
MWILNFNLPPCSYIWIVAEVVILKVVHPLKICQHTNFYGPTLTGASFASSSVVWKFHHRHIQKGSLKKTVTQIILIGMSITFHCTKLRLRKCNGSWVVAIKQNVNFKYLSPAIFVFFSVFRKNGFITCCSSSEYLSEYKISWSYWSFAFISDIWISPTLEWLRGHL